jgi:archaellum component FlaC
MDEVDSAKENLQYQSERVEDLKTQLEQAEQERESAANGLREAADNVATEYQSD